MTIQEIYSEDSRVTLRDLSMETLREVLKLEVAENQKAFVAPNAVSVAQAHYAENAWFKGIYADGNPVGFIMIDDDSSKPEYFLWRFMIDQRYQGMGYGKDALTLAVEYIKTRPGAKELLTSCVPGVGSPEGFYQKFGFVSTGLVEEGEIVYKLDLEALFNPAESHEGHSISSDDQEPEDLVDVDLRLTSLPPTADDLYALYDALDWNRHLLLSPEKLLEAMNASYKVLYAYAGDELVATGRLISDGITNAYLCGLGVHPDYQNQGIGKYVSEALFDVGRKNNLHLQLFCEEHLQSYYEKLGCEVFAVGMKLKSAR